MKAIIAAIMFILTLLFPSTAYSAPSRQIENSIIISPPISYELAESRPEWEEVTEWLDVIEKDLDGYVMLDALYLSLDQDYEAASIMLMRPLITEDEPIALFIEDKVIHMIEIGFDENGAAKLDLYEGNYFVCFYVRGE